MCTKYDDATTSDGSRCSAFVRSSGATVTPFDAATASSRTRSAVACASGAAIPFDGKTMRPAARSAIALSAPLYFIGVMPTPVAATHCSAGPVFDGDCSVPVLLERAGEDGSRLVDCVPGLLLCDKLHRAIAKRRIRADGRASSREHDCESGNTRSSGRRGSSDATQEGGPSGNRSCSDIGSGGAPSHARPVAWATPARRPSPRDATAGVQASLQRKPDARESAPPSAMVPFVAGAATLGIHPLGGPSTVRDECDA